MNWKTSMVAVLMLLIGIGIGMFVADRGPQATAVGGNESLAQAESAELGYTEAASVADWCFEHNVPESQCTRCDPARSAAFKERGDWCVEHDLPESHCRLCNPGIRFPQEIAAVAEDTIAAISVFFPKNKSLCATDGALIRFASTQTADRAGLTVVPAIAAPVGSSIEAPAEVVFDQTKTTVVTSTVPVTIVRWEVEPGTVVRAGQPIALVDSPEMARLQGEFLEHLADWSQKDKARSRHGELLRRDLIDSATHDLVVAEAASAEAEKTRVESELRLAGLTDAELDHLAQTKQVGSRFSLRASAAGALLERHAVPGVLTEPGTSLALVGDPEALWIEARVRGHDLPHVVAGQMIEFACDGAALDRVRGEIIWVSQFLDHVTRTGIVRARPFGDIRQLRAHAFGRLEIAPTGQSIAVLVPKEAVQWEGCCNVVFVRETQDRYRPRKVRIDRGDTEHYRILDGLSPGEEVVVSGSFLLKTELKKGSIGAGCCGIEPAS